MSSSLSNPITLRMNHARILLRHWQKTEVFEGYVREFSGDGTHFRVSHTPRERDRGVWLTAADYRCVDVLEPNFDFKAWSAREKESRKRDLELPGDEWKHGGDDE